jgi:hypothetical protein
MELCFPLSLTQYSVFRKRLTFFALKKTVASLFKMSVNFYQTKRSYIPEDVHHNAVRTSHLSPHKLQADIIMVLLVLWQLAEV